LKQITKTETLEICRVS